MNIVFPPAAFSDKGGPVVDITKPPYSAKGDGQSDDTAAFVAAFEYVQDLNEAKKPPVIIYVPNGTYLVSDTLARKTRLKVPADFNYRLVGQDRTKTVIRLKDNTPGFGEGAEKPVITCNPSNAGNGGMMWGHQLRNLTIDTGSGNPGAIGVIWRGANATVAENLTIRSGDGAGAIGFDFREWCVQGHFCDLTVEGFQIGIRTRQPAETHPVIEYVTLKNQRKTAIEIDRSTPSLRRVASTNTVPAIRIVGPGSQCVLVDSQLLGGDAANAAIELVDSKTSQLFVRDTKVAGYGTAIQVDGAPAVQGDVTEWLSGKVFSFNADAKAKTLRLPVQEAVLVPWESDPANWANPDDFEGNDVEKIQAALNSGKPAILFPRTFVLPPGTTLSVPASVRQMEFFNLDHKFQGGFRLTEPSPTPLWVNNPGDRVGFTIAAKRDLHARNGTFTSRVETEEPVAVHAQAICRYQGGWFDQFCPPNATVYGRSINEENWHDDPTPNWTVNGGTMWVLGFKTEGQNPAFHVKNKGRLEVLGGYVNFAGKAQRQNPDVINEESEVSYIGTNFMSRTHWLGIEEVRDGFAKRFENKDFPRRNTGQPNNYFVPLYVGLPGTKFEFSRIALPTGTEITADFATEKDSGPEKLFDGASGTWMVGAGGSYPGPGKVTAITLRFPQPIENLGAIRTGKSDKFHNYYPMRMEFWADTKGNGEFDSKIGEAATLGPDTKSEGLHTLPTPVSQVYALQIRVPEQHTGGGGRVWTMDEIALLRANR